MGEFDSMAKNPARTYSGAAAAIIAVLALAGCSTSSGDASDTAAKTAGDPAANDTSGISLPIDAYMFSIPQAEELNRAQAMLADTCMKKYGFDYEVPTGTKAPPGDPYANGRRYGVVKPELARKYGYHMPPNPDAPARNAAGGGLKSGPRANHNSDERLAMVGPPRDDPDQDFQNPELRKIGVIPDGGCIGQAGRRLAQGKEYGRSRTAAEIRAKSYAESQNAPAVLKVFKEWSACMAGKGYTFNSPVDPPRSPVIKGDTAGAEEIQMAVADVACKESADVVKVWRDTEAAMQNEDIAAKQEQLNDARAARDQQLKAAAKIVAGG